MDIFQLFNSGKLAEAISLAKKEVKGSPTDINARWILCELLAYTEDLELIIDHLNLIEQQDNELGFSTLQFGALVQAESHRRAVFKGETIPSVVSSVDENLEARIKSLNSLLDEDLTSTAETINEIEDSRIPLPGTCNGKPFDDLFDLDHLLTDVIEFYSTDCNYYWHSMSEIKKIEFDSPERIRDLLWRRVNIQFSEGNPGVVFMPMLYPGSYLSNNEFLKTGRESEWRENGGLSSGIGSRVFRFGDFDSTLRNLNTISFP